MTFWQNIDRFCIITEEIKVNWVKRSGKLIVLNLYGKYPYICKNNYMNNSTILTQTRFDVRLPKEQKEVIELAAKLSGFKSKSEFIVYTLVKEASLIIEKHTQIIASEKDQKLFFDAIINPPMPNKNLRKAAKNYNKLVASK